MFALITRILGPLIERYVVREAAEEIVKRYGVKFLVDFVKKAGPQLRTLSRDDILSIADELFQKQTGKLFREKIFSPSNARKFAKVVNKKIDYVEEKTREYVENRSKQILMQRMQDTLGDQQLFKTLNIPTATTGLGAKQHSKAYRAARGLASNTLEAFLFPQSKTQSFAGGFLRGLSGESLSRAVNRLIEVVLAIPQVAIQSPKYRTFYRVLMKEVKYLQQMGDVTNAKKLYNAINLAFKQANKPIEGVPEHLLRYSVAGRVTGRATVALGVNFVFVDSDERNRRIQRFKRSITPFAKERVKIYVQGYTRNNGTKVKGHYRMIEAA